MDNEFDSLGYGKKPFYKTVWFWILVVILIILLGVGIGMASFTTLAQEEELIRESKLRPIVRSSTVVVQNINEVNNNVDNSKAKAVTLNSGEFVVGKEIQPGMYIVDTKTSGNISVYDPSGEKIQEADISDKGLSIPIKSILVLNNGDKLKITGMKDVNFTPYVRDFKTVLNIGTYEVGRNIKQGNYIMEIPSGNGSVIVNNPIGLPIYSQIFSNQGSQSIKLTLANEDSVVVNGINGVHLVNIDNKSK